MPLIKLFLDICLLRKGPQDLPASAFLFRLVIAAYIVIGTLLAAPDTGWLQALLQTATETVMGLAVVAALLYAVNRPNRFLQMATAWMGTDALISLMVVPPLQMLAGLANGPMIAILWLGLIGWHVVIMAHIVRVALSQPMAIGFITAILYTAVSFRVMAFLFPVN